MILPVSPGTIEVVNRAGASMGHGFVWLDGKDIRQEWVFRPDYEWPPFGVVELRPAATAYGGVEEWQAARSALWTPASTFMRGVVERRDQIYPDPWHLALCAAISEDRLVGVAFAETTSKVQLEHHLGAGARPRLHADSVTGAAPLLFEAKETWLTSPDYQPPPLSVVRLGPYPADLFAPVGVTQRELLETLVRSERYTRTVVISAAYAGIPG